MNAPAPPSSLISLTKTSACWYRRSIAAEEDLPSDTAALSVSNKNESRSPIHARAYREWQN